MKCFHFCLHRSGYSLVRPFVPPSFLPLLCLPTPASLALVFITPFLVFACRAHTPAISFPVVSLSFSSFASTPHVPHSGSLSCPTSFAVPSSLSSPPPLRRRLCFPSPPVLLLLSLYKAESHPLLPMSLAFSSPCFHCRCIVGEPRPPVFLPPCLSWSPSFVDFPFLIRTPFFLSVCMLWCVLPLVVWRRWRRKAPKEGKGTGTLKVRVPRRTGGEGVERGRKGGLF